MTTSGHEYLRTIKTFPQLIQYLRDELDWPIESENFDDLTFDYEPEELGLDAKTAVKIKEIKQLRPLSTNQPWGIFFIDFAPKQLPVVALRRILGHLVIKKRQSAKKSQQASWQLHDLLFISCYGESDHRDITFAHFSGDPDEPSDLPTLRVLGWDDEDTVAHLEDAHTTLRRCLRWPEDTTKLAYWRTTWSEAFPLKYREVITTSKDLAVRLADLATAIRKRVNRVLTIESDKGPMRKLMAAFKEALIHDLSEDDFADMYAQTITYGLLSARVSRPAGLVAENIAEMVPITNPFLRDLLSTFLTVGGRKGKLDFDELGVNDVVQTLRKVNMEAVLRDFGDKNPQEDPVIHFYELFLKEYDPAKRVKRGVFYTPRPVVSFIVRSVHEILQKEFGLEDGLADTTTWGEMAKRHPELNIPEDAKPDDPFVQILDPACGTGTFLVEVIDLIHKTVQAKWRKEGHMELELLNLWNEYVSDHLLKRLYGFELMMAPYAIAHMKVGLKLGETGYNFRSHERARIYLTNSLEEPQDFDQQFLFDAPALAHEAEAVNAIKHDQHFTIIIGNPPYSRASSNKGMFIENLMERYKTAVRDERNIQPLSDDYIKFIRLSEHILRATGVGIHGMITNNTFLSGRIHRGMRESLTESFQLRSILNLHGSQKVDFLGAEGATDENVFDILQGVSISILTRVPTKPQLSYEELVGSRQKKYHLLSSHTTSRSNNLDPEKPYFLWIPRSSKATDEYQRYESLGSLFTFCSVSGKPGDDNLLVSLAQDEVLPKLLDFRRMLRNGSLPKLTEAGRNLAMLPQNKSFNPLLIIRYAYRPFDIRFTYYDADIWTRAVKPLKACVDGSPILLATKIVKDSSFSHVFVTRQFADVIFLSNTSSVNCYSFPCNHHVEGMNLDLERGGQDGNLHIVSFAEKLGEHITATDAFGYIYAILHSPVYRVRYFEFLQYDFPRLPLTENSDLFRVLARLGGELVALHLMESPKLAKFLAEFSAGKNHEVEKISWSNKTVWLDKAMTTGFKGVSDEVWNFHIGGYQVCEKWLKDRRGRTLSKEDIEHYQKIVVAISETIRIMAEIDQVIEAHGGWPGAFITSPK